MKAEEVIARAIAPVAWSRLGGQDDRPLEKNCRDGSIDLTDRIIAALKVAGFVIGPAELTEQMEAAYFEAHATAKAVFADPKDSYRAMLQAHRGEGK